MKLFAPLAVLALLAGPALAGADTVLVRTYEAGTVNLRISLADPAGVTEDGSIDVGGVFLTADQFPVGTTVVDVAFADAASPHVRGLLCQDFNANQVCGEAGAGEPRIEFCDSLAPGNLISHNGNPLAGGAALLVFVFAAPLRVSIGNPASNGPAPCPDGSNNFATQGTVTITLSP